MPSYIPCTAHFHDVCTMFGLSTSSDNAYPGSAYGTAPVGAPRDRGTCWGAATGAVRTALLTGFG